MQQLHTSSLNAIPLKYSMLYNFLFFYAHNVCVCYTEPFKLRD